MYYIICPTCGDLMGNKYIPYFNELNDLCQKYNIDRNNMFRKTKDDDNFKKESSKILKSKFKNICCRNYAMNAINVSDLIN